MEINQSNKNKAPQKRKTTILVISICVFVYYAVMILLGILKYDTILIGVFREMLTFPAIAALIVTTFLSLVSFVKEKFRINDLPFYSLLIQIVTIGLIVYIA